MGLTKEANMIKSNTISGKSKKNNVVNSQKPKGGISARQQRERAKYGLFL